MGLTKIQQGAIGQFEAAKLMMMGTSGKLEVAAPLSDDDRRDEEVHTRGRFGKALALQIKTTLRLVPDRAGYRVSFVTRVRTDRVVSHPLFWYLFAYLDQKTMAFGDPIFLVDSAAVHSSLRQRRGATYLAFHASMGPNSHDQWLPYRVHPADLGKRVLHILNSPGRLTQTGPGIPPRSPDLIWVGTHRAAAA